MGEGGEEILSGFLSALGQKMTYMSEKELGEIFTSEEAAESFIGGFILGGGSNVIQGVKANKQGIDAVTGLNQQEQAVVEKLYETRVAEEEKNGKLTQKQKSKIYDEIVRKLEKGYIPTDTIEEVLGGESYSAFKGEYDAFFGGETYQAYKDTVASEEAQIKQIEEQIKELEEAPNTVGNAKKYDALQAQIEEIKNSSKRSELKAQLDSEAARIGEIRNQLRTNVSEMVKDSRLFESYRELARSHEKYTTDLSKYTNEHARKTIQNIMDSGVANNTNEFHEFADWLANISADKGMSFTTTNAERLKGTKYDVAGKRVNAFIDENGNVTLNMDSDRAGQITVGHEITHVLEGTEFYGELQSAIKNYAVKKIGQEAYNARLEATKKLYEDIGDADKELTADLVGEYLFTDRDFIKNLSVQHRNVFEKIYDEIKYLCKVATAGSKEARELEKVKRVFEKAYKAGKNTADNSGAKYSLSEFEDGRRFVDVSVDQQQFDGLDDKAKTKLAINIIKSRFAGKTIGIDNPVFVNGRSAAEYGHPVKNIEPDIRDAKMRASTELDNLVDAGTNFRTAPDGADGHVHPEATGDFEYFDAIFKIGNEYYEGVVNIENVAKGRLFKDVTKIKNITQDISSSYGQNPKSTFLRDTSMRDISQTAGKVNYSLTDSDGKQLSEGQQEYFKDSKVRDENGNLLKVYHGTPSGGFTEFKLPEFLSTLMSAQGAGYYFTDKKNAEQYTKAVNKSVRNGTGKQLYEVYLNITDPLEIKPYKRTITKEQFKDVVRQGNRDWFRTDWMPFFADGGKAENQKLDFDTLLDKYTDKVFVQNNSDGDILAELTRAFRGGDDTILNVMKNVFGHDGVRFTDKYGDIWVAWSANQIKSVANTKPTDDADIRYSLSEGEYADKSYAEITVKQYALNQRERSLKERKRETNNNPELLQAMDDYRSLFSEMKELLPKKHKGTATQAELDRIEEINALREERMNRVVELQESLGLGEIANEEKAIREEKEALRVAADAAWKREGAEKENKAIEKSGLSAPEYFRKKATKAFKTTANFNEAGYMLPDGKLLNFSGGARNHRYIDHREIGEIYEATQGTDALNRFLSDGNIRIMAESPGIDIAAGVEPTKEQYAALRRFINSNGAKDGQFFVDFSDADGHRVGNYAYEGRVIADRILNDIKYYYATGEIREQSSIGRFLSLSEEGAKPKGRGVFGKDIALATPETHGLSPMDKFKYEEVAPVANADFNTQPVSNADFNTQPVSNADSNTFNAENGVMFPDDLAPMSEEMDADRLASLTDEDAPPETEAPYQMADEVTVDDPFDERDIDEVGKRSVKAYMYENPEVKPFFQTEAQVMLGELRDTVKGERWVSWSDHNGGYGAESYYQYGGVKRHTSDDIAYLLDNCKYTYAEIEKGLKAIIEDDGKENNAVSKRIEFILNDRLLDGYEAFGFGGTIPPNQDYINLLNEKQITEYSKEAFDAFMANADAYAPPVAEASPVTAPVKDTAPVKETAPIKPEKPKAEPKVAKVLTEEPKVNKNKPGVWAMFKNNVLDKGMVFEDLALKTGDRELQARWNSIRYADARAQRFMEKGGASTSSLDSIRKAVESTGKTQQFFEYLYHQLNVDRMTLEDRYAGTENKPVFGYDVTADMSREVVSKLENSNPEFKKFAEDVYSYMGSLREMLVEGGVISRETANLLAEMYPHYVPVRRVGDEGLSINVALDTKRTGVNAPIKRATGGNRDILPLFDTMAQRTLQTYKAIAKNRFGVELKSLIGGNVDSEAVSVDEAIESVDSHEGLLQEGKDGRNPTFTVFENGEKVTFEITEEMYRAMKPTSEGLAYTNKVLNKANNIRRGLITEYNPAFMLTNPIKDAQDVLINSQHPAKTYANFPKAIAELWGKNGHWYSEYMENGGEHNTYFEKATNTFAKEKSGIAKVVGFPLEKISEANNFIERIPRMAEYIASRKEGRSIDVAMLDAARVTTNFAAGGDLTKFANRNGFTFLNASVQGAVQQVRNVREAKANGLKGWAQLAGKIAIAGLPSILLNHLLWDDDEDYAELSDYVKQNYYIVGKYGDGKFVRIPKGRALAVIQNAFEQMESAVTGNDEVDLRTFGELVVSNLAPNNPLDNNIIAPIGQAMNNRTWYGEDLVPSRLQDLPAAEQYDESTDSISKWLGEKLDVSPYKINYLLDQYSGGVGDMLLPMLTTEAESGDNSFLGNMIAPIKSKFTTDSVMNNQNVSDFYDTKDELNVKANASGATDEDVLRAKYMNSASADFAKLYAQKREIQNSDMPDDEKYEAVREIQKQIDMGMEEALNDYGKISYEEDYREGGKYARVGDGKLYKLDDEGEWQKLSDEQVTKYEVTKAAGDSNYATDGENHYRWYVPGEDAGEDAEAGWRKVTDKEYERQQEVTDALDISPEEYWSNREEYSYAYDNPESYAVAKAVGGYEAYRTYSGELYDIKADKDKWGQSISGSRKEKVLEYINNLDADYYTKIILWKSEYNSDDSYNMEIIDYLNGREDISYEDMEAILLKLGFKVDSNGNISW